MILDQNWLAFTASTAALNTYLRPSVLRKYQSELLNSGKFSVVSPISGRTVEVTRSIQVDDQIAYLISDDTDAWLIAGFVLLGFPLYELVTADGTRRKLLDVGKQYQELGQAEVEHLLTSGPGELDADATAGATLVIGHPHFAHHLWNELAGLDEWLRTAPDQKVETLSIVTTNEPLGPLREIFPRLSGSNIVSSSQRRLHKQLTNAPIAVRVGSSVVTKEVCRKVREFSERRGANTLDHPAIPLLQDAWPRIWVSVRVDSARTADNMEAFLLRVFREVFRVYPEAAFLLIGYSFRYGSLGDSGRTNTRSENARAQSRSADTVIANLCSKAEAQLGATPASRICSISGLELPDAIRLGSYCDYYICHAGTLQHMIGWFHDIPGVIHSPCPEGKKLIYNADAVEGGVVPDVMPKAFIVSDTSPASRPGPRNFNYEFADVGKSADFVVDLMQSRLGRMVSAATG